jgi:ribosomal protein S18 acetylase RimI-like enzyme
MIGVLEPYRRRGLARALIARAFAVHADRGTPRVLAEADATNGPSNALMESLGATIIGGTVELYRS